MRSEEYLYYARMQAGGTNRAGNHGLERRHEHGHERGHERGRARRVNEHGDGRGHGFASTVMDVSSEGPKRSRANLAESLTKGK